jgi:serine/threonine protein kinase
VNELLGSNGRIGRFIIEAEVGRGGMGVVYRCTDPLHDRPVALKLLAPHLLSDTQALARFQREASLVATLRHKHIADFYEFDEQGERPYIVLEWIEGHSLKELLASQGELSLEMGLNLVQQLANALDFAHARGIIHRDLKPANIMIGQHNRAKIVDFGMALLETAPSLTTTNFIVGTPLYMSPEQILGKPLDGRSDQYSLAVIIYEMLGGQPPFSPTNTAALYHQQLNVMPPLVTHLNPQLPPAIAAVLHRALAKEPSQRFNSITEFAQALQSPTEADMTLPTPQPRRPKAILRDSEGESWVLQNESFVIGRYPPADLVLDRPRISRQHARIEYRDFGYFLIDLDSRNGSFVNGRTLDQTPQRLNDGDEIVLGGTVSLRFFDPEETTHGPRLGRLQGVWIDEKLHTVWVDAQLVDPPFSTAQLALLSLLYRRAGEIVSRTEIVTTVWTDIDPEGVSSEAVDGLIKRLRGRLRPYNTSQEYIEVVRGHGLRLNQPP